MTEFCYKLLEIKNLNYTSHVCKGRTEGAARKTGYLQTAMSEWRVYDQYGQSFVIRP